MNLGYWTVQGLKYLVGTLELEGTGFIPAPQGKGADIAPAVPLCDCIEYSDPSAVPGVSGEVSAAHMSPVPAPSLEKCRCSLQPTAQSQKALLADLEVPDAFYKFLHQVRSASCTQDGGNHHVNGLLCVAFLSWAKPSISFPSLWQRITAAGTSRVPCLLQQPPS